MLCNNAIGVGSSGEVPAPEIMMLVARIEERPEFVTHLVDNSAHRLARWTVCLKSLAVEAISHEPEYSIQCYLSTYQSHS